MNSPTITKRLAAHDFLRMAVDAMQDDEVEGPRVILGPVALERFAQAVYKLGRNAGLEEATREIEQANEDRQLYVPDCIDVIESLKDNTP